MCDINANVLFVTRIAAVRAVKTARTPSPDFTMLAHNASVTVARTA